MSGIVTFVATIVIFSVMIFVHEFGHFISAKSLGIEVQEFAIGMGPAILKKQGKETLYSIRILPFGGFCRMEGEEQLWDTGNSFSNKPVWSRMIVIVAGSFMNILLGFVLALGLYFSYPTTASNIVSDVVAGSAVAEAGIEAGDRIVGFNGGRINCYVDLTRELTMLDKTENIEIVTERNGERITHYVTPTIVSGKSRVFGFQIKKEPTTFKTVIRDASSETYTVSKLVFWSLGQLFKGEASVDDLSGPVGIVSAINDAAKTNTRQLLFLMILLTVNLGIMNMLPIPGLDGGRFLFLIIELLRGKPVPPEKEGWVHFAGFMFLILLSLFIMYNDIIKLLGL